tara:strand:- start:42 stop:209 length:168 start_codon:yes stop_codon:yes gene_type:complete
MLIMIFIIPALLLPAYFMVCGLVHSGHIKPNKFTKYAGINMITEKQEYNLEEYYG